MSSNVLHAWPRTSHPGLILLSSRAPYLLCAAHQTGGTPIALVFDLPTLVQDASRHCRLHVHHSAQQHPSHCPPSNVHISTLVPSIRSHRIALGCTYCEPLMHLFCSCRRLSGAACSICLGALKPCRLQSSSVAVAAVLQDAACLLHGWSAVAMLHRQLWCCICFPRGVLICLSGMLGMLHLWQCCCTCNRCLSIACRSLMRKLCSGLPAPRQWLAGSDSALGPSPSQKTL